MTAMTILTGLLQNKGFLFGSVSVVDHTGKTVFFVEKGKVQENV